MLSSKTSTMYKLLDKECVVADDDTPPLSLYTVPEEALTCDSWRAACETRRQWRET